MGYILQICIIQLKKEWKLRDDFFLSELLYYPLYLKLLEISIEISIQLLSSMHKNAQKSYQNIIYRKWHSESSEARFLNLQGNSTARCYSPVYTHLYLLLS